MCQAVIHELMHHAYWSRLDTWGELHEPFTEAAEDLLRRYVNHSRRRRSWWRETIRAKVEADED